MQKSKLNLITRRGFLDRSMKVSMGIAMATLTDIPFVVKRALAEGNIGLNGKKLLFIFLRGANDSLNSVIPIRDSAYVDFDTTSANFGKSTNRPNIVIPPDQLTDYSTTGPCDFPISASPTAATFSYAKAIRTGNGFAALHPSLKFLAPVYNAGDLALIHRVGYPNQSRSHFDSQNYWENGAPNNKLVTDGIFHRAMIQSGLANTAPLTGISIQSALPRILQGNGAAMTNLSDPTRYDLLGIPHTGGDLKADAAIKNANLYPFSGKMNREFLGLQYENLSSTLPIFASIGFSDSTNTYKDADVDGTGATGTDGDDDFYYLFPTSNAKNGGYALHGNDTSKYVIDTGGYSLFTNLKAASLILNQTDAIVAGTEFSGFDTHNNQGSVTGGHANLQRRIGWAMYSLRKFFKIYGKNGTTPMTGAKVSWDDLIVVTLSEFGRTSIQNGSFGTDHAEAGVMFMAGGGLKGYGKPGGNGLYACSTGGSVPWQTGQAGSMFGAGGRYLKRAVDYRQVLGKLIRDHLGASQNQLNQIIPGYANPTENLIIGGNSIDGTPILSESALSFI
ncbi:MAG: hypothetical protein JWM68_3000 [Verrucomicrobiales bacterium]|nr:hypothetical protein [Verrucomicrobiales bacterium]